MRGHFLREEGSPKICISFAQQDNLSFVLVASSSSSSEKGPSFPLLLAIDDPKDFIAIQPEIPSYAHKGSSFCDYFYFIPSRTIHHHHLIGEFCLDQFTRTSRFLQRICFHLPRVSVLYNPFRKRAWT